MSEDFDFENIQAETPLSPDEAIIRRHRKEKKELQGKIQAMKKTVTKNDKKKKKDIAEEIAKLEVDMEARHKLELDAFKPKRVDLDTSGSNVTADKVDVEEPHLEHPTKSLPKVPVELNGDSLTGSKTAGDGEDIIISSVEAPPTPKMSKARKRREKKEAEERERQKRIEVETEDLVNDSDWKKEDVKLESVLEKLHLKVVDIPSDGHCLYKAVSHQLDQHGESISIAELRRKTASFLLEHQEEYINFFDETVSASPEKFAMYCNEIESTSAWGGQIEVKVLSQVLKKRIQVIQADGPPLLFGKEFPKPTLTLTYHRHKYKLGAHYNSAVLEDAAQVDA